MASASVSDISPRSKRARKFYNKDAMTQYHQYSVLVDKLHLDMLYTADTVERGWEILTLSPERQPFIKCREVLMARLEVVHMIRDGPANFKILYIKFMESVGVDHVSTMATLRETVLTFLECSSMEQLDQISRSMAFRLSTARKIFQSAMHTAELVQHMAVSEDIPIPAHLAVLQPRPHAAAPPPVAVEAAPGVESIGVRVV